MDNLVYHSVVPANDNSLGFTEFNTIDFELEVEGRKLIPNSIRVDFDLEVFSSTGVLTNNKRVAVDNYIGGHAFFESWQVSTQSQGLLSNEQEYSRWAKTFFTATLDADDTNSAYAQAEGRSCHPACGEVPVEQVANHGTDAAATLIDNALTIKPLISLNRMMGDGYSFSKNGFIRVSCNLARNNNALYGADAVATTSYILKNVRLRFTTMPDNGKQGKMLMNSYTNIKATSNSQAFTIDSKVPSKLVNGVVINFIDQARENDTKSNTHNLEQYPQLDSVTYSFNNALNKYITYSITDRGDMVRKGLQALTDGNLNHVNSGNLYNNQSYLIGLPFTEYIDLSTQKFSVELKSGSTAISQNHKTMFLYFLTLISL